jgi:transposase
LFQEIQQQGPKGDYASVMRYLQPLQGTKPSIPTGSPVNQVRTWLKQKSLMARRAAWLTAASDSAIPQFQRFVTGLRSDYAAVRAALSMHVSDGPMEGLNNRLKTLKRQRYGPAGIDSLTRRFPSSA